MRTKKQILFDNAYYGIEQWISRFFRNRRAKNSIKGLTFDKEFYDTFKNTVRPYWKKYGIHPNINWFKFYYHLTGTVDPRYIPDDVHHFYIIPHFDDLTYIRQMEDKNLFHLLLPTANHPDTVLKHVDNTFCNEDFTPISKEDVYDRLAQLGRFIVKPTRDTGEGADISFLTGPAEKDAVDALLEKYGSLDFIIQRMVSQHPDLSAFNASSLNTIRVVTMVLHGKAHILSAILRIGQSGSLVDNISKGGYQAVIHTDTGMLDKMAYTHENGIHKHVDRTASGTLFEGARIPCWDKVRETATELALKLPHLKLIGWDFGVDDQGRVILIEFNCHFGQNQENCGPTFGDMTEKVLNEVFRKKSKIK